MLTLSTKDTSQFLEIIMINVSRKKVISSKINLSRGKICNLALNFFPKVHFLDQNEGNKTVHITSQLLDKALEYAHSSLEKMHQSILKNTSETKE